eukprot:jgi/Chlat1/4160/Chrsp27S04262
MAAAAAVSLAASALLRAPGAAVRAVRRCPVPSLTPRRTLPTLRRRRLSSTVVANAAPLEHTVATPTLTTQAAPSGFDKSTSQFTVTTPLYYVNASPHMGSAYPTIAADALARYNRLLGKRVAFVTGVDEHGEKIAEAASAAGREPQAHCDAVAEEFKELWTQMDIEWDRFARTTDPRHEKVVLEFFQRVWDRGDIYRAAYTGKYCVACEEYKDETELLEGDLCPIHRKPCPTRNEDNFFFKLSNYQTALEELFANNPDFVRPSYRRNEHLSRGGELGHPYPGGPEPDDIQGDEVSLEAAVARGWPASDILRFHAVYWPAMLLSAGLPLPTAVYGHGFLTKDGLKMGKSLGNVLEPKRLVEAYGSDAVRYFFLKEIEFGKDGDFSNERFINIVNANLANDIGNLLNRTLNLLKKFCSGSVPVAASALPSDHPMRALAASSAESARAGYEQLAFGAVCEACLAMSGYGNGYMEEKAPWSMFKKGEAEKAEAAMHLVAVLETVRIVSVMLSPITPGLSRRVHLQLGYNDQQFDELRWDDTRWGGLQEGQVTAKPAPVFARLEPVEDLGPATRT